MAKAERALRLVDTDTGEVVDDCPGCRGKDYELRELQRKMRGLARELGELRADKDAEARAHESWPLLISLFEYWKQETGHANAKWTPRRFWEALQLIKTFGAGNCAAAIAGIAYEPNRKELKNGKWEVFDTWELLFRNAGNVERYIKRRPKGWVCPPQFLEQ